MKKRALITAVIALMLTFFGGSSHGAIENCDFSNPKDGDIDGSDLSQFMGHYAAGDSTADVDESGTVNAADVAHFAGFFGDGYTVTARPPNILLIIADDIGIDVTTDLYPNLIPDLEDIYGVGSGVKGKPASTPVLRDRLAQQGMVFSNTWAQPVCSPTRASLITGLFEKKTGVFNPGIVMSSNHTTFVQKLRDVGGYSTAAFGKWHLGTSATNGTLPLVAGFEHFRGHTGAAIEDFWNYNYDVQDDPNSPTVVNRVRPAPDKSLPGIGPTKFAPVVKAADAIEWITSQETDDPDKPWFVWLAFNEAHWPMHVPDAATLNTSSYDEVTGCGGVPGTNTRGSCSDKVLVRAMTNAMDTVIGKILDVVDSLDPNTVVIFIGDNGTESDSIENMYLTTSNRGKGTVYESGARVAMAVRGPGISARSESGEFVHAADLYNTCLNIAGLPPDTQNKDRNNQTVPSDSVSLTPILFGSASTVRNSNEGYILTETDFGGKKVGARNAFYKVVCVGGTSNCEFYDLIDDPLEEYPLSKPGSCTNYRTTFSTTDPEWHYCRLIEVVNLYSIF